MSPHEHPEPATSAQKLERLAHLLRARAARQTTPQPTSHGQQALWYLYRLDPESPAYNVAFAFRVRSPIDAPAMRGALLALTERHPVLRTTYLQRDGEALRTIHARLDPGFDELDASTWAEAELAERVQAARCRPFDLERGPILRGVLFHRAPDDHVLLLVAHHIAVDGWSLWILIDELKALYPAVRAGHPPELPLLSVQYGDFVRWQRDLLGGPEGERLWAYWQQRLSGKIPNLDLPLDLPRPPVQTFRGASHPFTIRREPTQRIVQLSKAHGATLFAVLLAAYQTLLSRHSGERDILVGTPMAGRSRQEFSPVVGDFINMVVLRADLTNDPSTIELLQQTRQTITDALSRQDYPFALLVDRLRVPRDPARSPLFQASFVFQQPSTGALTQLLQGGEGTTDFGGLAVAAHPLPQQEGQFDVTLEVLYAAEELHGNLKYNADLFLPETVERMARHYAELLAAMVETPERPVGRLRLLGKEEREAVLRAGQGPSSPLEGEVPFYAPWEKLAEREPSAIAVEDEGKRLTRAEVNARANRLARRLRAMGVGPEVSMGLSLQRGVDLVVGLLGVLKAGGMYVPLDPGYPRERLSYMLEDAAVKLLLTDEASLEQLPTASGVETLLLQDVERSASDEPASDLKLAVAAEQCAYMLYTSGSTGRPKGVQVPHGALANFLRSMAERPGLSATDVLLAVTPLSFDIAGLELYLPLVTGARLVVASQATSRDPERLGRALAQHGVTVMQGTPSTYRLLLQHPEVLNHGFKALCGGEALPGDVCCRLLEHEVALWNMYGPTETTIWSAAGPVQDAARVDLGTPVDNTDLYVLDEALELVPLGVSGELYIGGAGLARGYWRRRSLSAERFVPDPFSTTPGARMYRTGDVVRRQADGRLLYQGRSDAQVKIRGFRIELGEVEAWLSTHPSVRAVVVSSAEDERGGGAQLVAYVVPSGAAPSVEALRAHLQERLPEYMVPGQYMVLDELPLTPAGKVDRKRLPRPTFDRASLQTRYTPPRTEQERLLTELWQQILGRTPVGIHDDFFALGGDSLRVVQLAQHLREAGLDIRPADILRHPTIAELAHPARQRSRATEATAPIPLDKVALPASLLQSLPPEIALAYPLTAMQEVMLDEHAKDAGRRGIYHLQYALHLRDEGFSLPALEAALATLVRRNPALRTVILEIPGAPRLQGVLRTAPPSLEIEDLRALTQEERQRVSEARLQADRGRPFETGPSRLLSRFRILLHTDHTFEIHLSCHHAILDGWSSVELFHELLALYGAHKRGEEIVETPEPHGYRDFVALEREARDAQPSRAFWLDHLRGSRRAEPAPATSVESWDRRVRTVHVEAPLLARLHELRRRWSVSLRAILLGTYLHALQKIGGEAVPVGVVSSGRSARLVDPLRTRGLLWNLTPFHCPPRPDLVAHLREVQARLIALDPHVLFPASALPEFGPGARFAATFNFVDFAGTSHQLGESVDVLGFRHHDRFHTPLNLTASVARQAAGLELQLDYDHPRFTQEAVDDLLQKILRRLSELEASPAASTATSPAA
ncbi:non-ribosomal peptide synthetase [Chondromyces crocatus]|uniref:Non-ribosomal peptide synthetase n=1 Tax=Chondromyces crocatus TaxID=52 RepID=G4RJC0_CHOCO|nr:non-ribosomal peptide synthetase [Chondromyces crocatus]AIR74925.1 non-ribosomal peptide synthetase [Chondromyces crocatus]AKT38864.1 uncharacterized protein CMC5_030100 [Chondromyces crocatus]CBD77749.1 non-ribosomal peptide synthetase [Chondromyces crocatus]